MQRLHYARVRRYVLGCAPTVLAIAIGAGFAGSGAADPVAYPPGLIDNSKPELAAQETRDREDGSANARPIPRDLRDAQQAYIDYIDARMAGADPEYPVDAMAELEAYAETLGMTPTEPTAEHGVIESAESWVGLASEFAIANRWQGEVNGHEIVVAAARRLRSSGAVLLIGRDTGMTGSPEVVDLPGSASARITSSQGATVIVNAGNREFALDVASGQLTQR